MPLFSLSLMWGAIKQYWLAFVGAVLAVAMFALYVMGRKDGQKIEQVETIKHDLEVQQATTDFYKDMGKAELEAQINRPADRSELVNRLRDVGL